MTDMSLNISEWVDYKDDDDFPDRKRLILALDRPLKTEDGPKEHFVALWYRHGHPVMGRVWPEKGKINATFSNGDKIFTGKSLGQLQILVQPPTTAAGFSYCWKPIRSVTNQKDQKEYHPVHLSFISPCVLVTKEGYELLGGANLKEDTAQSSWNGNIIKFSGKDIEGFNILCRKICDDTMQI